MTNQIDICEELAQNFLDFSYEANSQRAFPDARDGLKPGQRACLWEMFTKGYSSSKPFVKSAKISGGVIATWWPHGETAIYETFARMSQDWINNVPEIGWHGMNGSQIISGSPAAARYTEARLAKVVEEGMFNGIKKNNVPMIPNFSEDAEWPEVLPAIFPRLLVNGCQGIGVTIANTWLPHSFTDIANLLLKYIDTGEVDTKSIYPSFPSGGIIINKDDVHTIYETGKGKVILRGKTEIKGNSIFISEMPYQVYVEPFIEEIKNLVKEEELTGIEDIKNRSDKKGLLIEIVCEDNPDAVLSQLYNKTDLQSNYNANQWALVGKTPRLLTLKDCCEIYVAHNVECFKREVDFDLTKAEKRLHIVKGLLIALEDIDNVIKLIKESSSAATAKQNLISKYNLDEIQAQAILDMKLSRLAHLEKMELENEKKELLEKIGSLQILLTNKELQLAEVKNRLSSLVKKFGDTRKTELQQINLTKAKKEKPEVIPEDCVVIITQSGLVKRIPTKSFKPQKRATAGIKTGDDIVIFSVKTNTIDTLLVFSNNGKMYRINIGDIPEGTNLSRGIRIVELAKMANDEKPMAYTSISGTEDWTYMLFATKNGIIKKVPKDEYLSIKRTGVSTIKLKEGDSLVCVTKIKENGHIMLITKQGMAIRFKTAEMPISSRIAQGVKGITLNENDKVLTALPIDTFDNYLVIVSADGLGKKIALKEFNIQGRGGKGMSCYKGDIGGAVINNGEDNILISGNKNSILISAKDFPTLSRTSQGNIMLKNNIVTSITAISSGG